METHLMNEPEETPSDDPILQLASVQDVVVGTVGVKRRTVVTSDADLGGAVLLGQDALELPAIALHFETMSDDKKPVHLAVTPRGAIELMAGITQALLALTAMGVGFDDELVGGEEADDADGR
jgi:hypothetical protein